MQSPVTEHERCTTAPSASFSKTSSRVYLGIDLRRRSLATAVGCGCCTVRPPRGLGHEGRAIIVTRSLAVNCGATCVSAFADPKVEAKQITIDHSAVEFADVYGGNLVAFKVPAASSSPT